MPPPNHNRITSQFSRISFHHNKVLVRGIPYHRRSFLSIRNISLTIEKGANNTIIYHARNTTNIQNKNIISKYITKHFLSELQCNLDIFTVGGKSHQNTVFTPLLQCSWEHCY